MHRRLLVAFDVVFRGFCCVLPLMMSARASKAKPKRRRSMTGKKTAPHIQGPIRRCDYAMHQGSIISPPGGLPLLPILGWCGRDTTPHRPPAHHRRQRQGRQAHGSAATTPYSIILPYLGLLRVGYGCPHPAMHHDDDDDAAAAAAARRTVPALSSDHSQPGPQGGGRLPGVRHANLWALAMALGACLRTCGPCGALRAPGYLEQVLWFSRQLAKCMYRVTYGQQ
jgi:hypothetical protein